MYIYDKKKTATWNSTRLNTVLFLNETRKEIEQKLNDASHITSLVITYIIWRWMESDLSSGSEVITC